MNLRQIKLLGILMCFSLFLASCSDDDNNSSYSINRYDKNSNNLTYTGEAAASALSNAEFIIETNNNKATLTANNAIIGSPTIKIDNIDLVSVNGKTTFKASTSNNDRDITFNGTISDNKLSIDGNLEFKSEIIGAWEMPITQDFVDGKMGIVDWSATVKAGLNEDDQSKAETTSGMIEFLGNMIGGTIGSEIDQLSIDFKKNGIIAMKYHTIVDNQTHQNLPLDLALNYFIRDGKLFVAMPADLLKAIPADLKKNEVIAAALSLIKEEGGYAYVELKTTQGEIHKDEIGEYTLFYVDDAVFSVLNPVIVKYVQENIDSLPIPDGLEFMGMQLTQEQAKVIIANIVSGLPYLDNYKFGLGFKRVTSSK